MPNPLFQKFLETKNLTGMYIGLYYVPYTVTHQNRCQFCVKYKTREHYGLILSNNIKLAFEKRKMENAKSII